jgi:FMN phosphatase YigB (HAD superfamily)
LPKDLAPRLLHRFSSDEGYMLSPGVDSLLRRVKQQHQQRHGSPQIIVGVITNSDDRVPNILSSLGLRVSPLRYHSSADFAAVAGQQYDVDLHCMSYDVGYAKPDRRIFDAAEEMANQLLLAQGNTHLSKDGGRERKPEAVPWLKLYVGDEYEKDVVGARRAGWNAVFVGAEEEVPGQEKMPGLRQLGDKSLEEVFPQGGSPVAIRAESTQMLLEWLRDQHLRGNRVGAELGD